MKHRYIAGLLLAFLLLARCGTGNGEKEPELFTALVWNVQNLFDGQDNGSEYAEFSEAGGWTQEKYAARITAISRALLSIEAEQDPGPGGGTRPGTKSASPPGLIGFTEVENLGVLEDLAASLSKHGYYWLAFANVPGASVGLGAISRFPITDARAHSITLMGETSPRPVLEIRIRARANPGGDLAAEDSIAGGPDGSLVFLLCHWKSKTGGEDETTLLRQASARVVQRLYGELREEDIYRPLIVMGDLNENHDEFYRRGVLSALLPDDPDAASLVKSNPVPGFIVLSGEKPPVAGFFSSDVHAFYSPWLEDNSDGEERGSYFFRDAWETIDHFLLSDNLFNGSNWEYSGSHVLNKPPFSNSQGRPNRYTPRTGSGLSDHLPLMLYLLFNQ